MVSRYHWLSANASGTVPGSSVATLLDTEVTIPAGGILKKVLIDRTYVAFKQTGTSDTAIAPWTMLQECHISSGPNVNRVLFQGYRRVNMAPVAYLQGFTNTWTAWHQGGDNEFGANRECSYGKLTDALSWKVLIQMHLIQILAGQSVSIAASQFSAQCRFLYYK